MNKLSLVARNLATKPSHIRTAAALVIGWVILLAICLSDHHRDEILNGKTLDRNSHYFAQYCFELGIDLCVSIHRQHN